MSQLYHEITACRSCGSPNLAEAMDLGLFYLSDFQDSPDGFTDRAPLSLVRCQECSLVQLRHTVDRDRLYRAYWYRSGTNESMVRALQDVVDDALCRVELHPGELVLDIGANDGTLLRQYPEVVTRVGVEPSQTFAQPEGAELWLNAYWPLRFALQPKAKIITSVACFYDSTIPNDFVAGIKKALAPDGAWINQLAYLPSTMAANNFGDICHEHLTYWTITSFVHLLERHGLMLEDWSFNETNGGSVRFIVRHTDGSSRAVPHETDGLLEFKRFAQRVRLQRSEVRDFLHRAKRDGKKVIGYGASTKGNTYLQYWGIDPDLLTAIADRNPDKHGKYVPTGQVVISEEQARAERPDFFFILPFHFLDAFVDRERDYLSSGGKFIVPFPEPHVIGGDDAHLRQTDPPEAFRPIQAA